MTMMNEQRKRQQQQLIQQIRDLARNGQWQEAKQLAVKLPNTPETTKMKERIEQQLLITTTEARAVTEDRTPLVSASTKPQPSGGGVWIIAIWATLVILVAVIAGVAGYRVGVQQTRSEYEIPPEFEDAFVDSCTANTDVSAIDCAELIRSQWLFYRAEVVGCYGLIQDVADLTEGQFLRCIGNVRE